MKYFRYFFFLVVALCSTISVALAAGTAGFIQGNIWYSKDPFFVGDTVRIYSGIVSGGSDDIIGTVEFYDNAVTIGKADFTLTSGGTLSQVWTDWQASEGTHTITAKITQAFVSRAGKPNEPVHLDNAQSGTSERVVDIDTDRDGIGNAADLDDDNDGVSDTDELSRGTDPLRADTDGDGLSDKTDPHPLIADQADAPTVSTAGNNTLADISNSAPVQAAKSAGSAITSVAAHIADSLEGIKARVDADIAALKVKELGPATTTASQQAQQIGDVVGQGVATTTATGANPTVSITRIAKQAYSWLLFALIFILRTPWLLYLVLALIVYWFFRRWRRRRWEKRG